MSLEGLANVEYASLTGKIHTIVVDKTLTISGACADAKATGDKIDTFEQKVDYANSSVEEAKKTYEGMIANMTEAAEAAAHEAVKSLSAEELGAYVKSQVLSDETKALFGFGEDAVPNDVLTVLAQLKLHCWEKEATVKQYVLRVAEESSEVPIVVKQNHSNDQKTIYYGDTIEMDEGGNLSIPNEILGKVCYSGYSQGYSNPDIGGKYFTIDHATYYKVDEGGDFIRNRDYDEGEYDYYVDAVAHVVYADEVDEGEQEYAFSTERNAYPDNGEADGFSYAYKGVPLDNALAITRSEVGTYQGTGVSGVNNPNSLTFDFVPKIVLVMIEDRSAISSGNYGLTYIGQPGSDHGCAFTLADKTLSWYDKDGASGQLNDSGITYYYVAMG